MDKVPTRRRGGVPPAAWQGPDIKNPKPETVRLISFTARGNYRTDVALALELQLLREPAMPAPVKEAFQKKIDEYKKTADRYESEPETRDGKKELMVRAKAHEAARDHALRQDPWFDYGEGMLQIAIVLLSVSIIGSIPALYLAGSALGVLGFLATLNGYLLLV